MLTIQRRATCGGLLFVRGGVANRSLSSPLILNQSIRGKTSLAANSSLINLYTSRGRDADAATSVSLHRFRYLIHRKN